LLIEQRANVQRKAIEKIRRGHNETEMATGLNLSVANLRKEAPFILGARLDDDRHAVLFDGLRKTDGPLMLGDFRYDPVSLADLETRWTAFLLAMAVVDSYAAKFR
jgi:hypothetical protein